MGKKKAVEIDDNMLNPPCETANGNEVCRLFWILLSHNNFMFCLIDLCSNPKRSQRHCSWIAIS